MRYVACLILFDVNSTILWFGWHHPNNSKRDGRRVHCESNIYNILEPRNRMNVRTREIKNEPTQCNCVAIPLRQSARMILILVFFFLLFWSCRPCIRYTQQIVFENISLLCFALFCTPSRCIHQLMCILDAFIHLTILWLTLRSMCACACVYVGVNHANHIKNARTHVHAHIRTQTKSTQKHGV